MRVSPRCFLYPIKLVRKLLLPRFIDLCMGAVEGVRSFGGSEGVEGIASPPELVYCYLSIFFTPD